MVVEQKVKYCRENFRIHLKPIRHFYGVQFLNKSVKSFVIFHLLFQSADKPFVIFHQLFQSADKPFFYNSKIIRKKNM